MTQTRIHALVAVSCLALLFTGCAGGSNGSRSSGTSAGIEYYYGTTTITSPDGRIPYGPPVMTLMRREITPSQDRIVEIVTRNGRSVTTTLEREGSGRFSASASDNSIDGSIEVDGDDWQWDEWRYSLNLTDGSGVIEGEGRMDGKWLELDRYQVATNGERRSRVFERLARVSPEEYERRMAEMKAHPPR